jgi:hypothetical protein
VNSILRLLKRLLVGIAPSNYESKHYFSKNGGILFSKLEPCIKVSLHSTEVEQ